MFGACVNAPVLQVNDDFYEDLDYQTTNALLDSMETGVPLPSGSVIDHRDQSQAGQPRLPRSNLEKLLLVRKKSGGRPMLNDTDRIFTNICGWGDDCKAPRPVEIGIKLQTACSLAAMRLSNEFAHLVFEGGSRLSDRIEMVIHAKRGKGSPALSCS